MALSVRVTQVRRVVATGKIYIAFADGPILEFSSLAEVKDWAKDIDTDEAREKLRQMIIRYYLIRDPNGTTPNAIDGKTMTLDLASATPLVVT